MKREMGSSAFTDLNEIFDLQGVKVCPNVVPCEHKHVKMQVWDIRVACHANPGYLLAGAHLLAHPYPCAAIFEVVVSRVFPVWVPNCDKVGKIPV